VGRFITYSVIALLVGFVLVTTFALQHGGSSVAAVRSVTIHDLVAAPALHEGETVKTVGDLSFSPEHGLYQIVDEEGLAIVIRDHQGDISSLVGRSVEVSGRFDFDRDTGLYIEAVRIRAIGR
jgi:hypothetical protein